MNNIRIPVSFEANGEDWMPLNYQLHPELKQIYYVSTYGRVLSNGSINFRFPKSKYLNLELSNVGYYRVSLIKHDNLVSHYSIHRLVLETFCPVENMSNLVVNHINGIKTDNHIWNLEWCTNEENAQHAMINNLVNWRLGDDCSWATIDSEKADIIGKMLIDDHNYTYKEIADILGCSKSIVTNIANGISWRDVYLKYKLWKFRHPIKPIFSYDQKILLSQYIYDNIDKYDPSTYRSLCMNACKDVLNIKTNRSIIIELMDIIYEYNDLHSNQLIQL